MSTVEEFLRKEEVPVIAIDNEGLVFFVNDRLEREFGWSKAELLGRSITAIMPAPMRDAHTVGFSRLLNTGVARLLGKPLSLSVLRKDGRVVEAEHRIVGEQRDGQWRFAATIRPAPPAAPEESR